MAKRILILLSLTLLTTPIVNAHEIKIDRVWVEYDYGNALVTYKNTSQTTYRTVTIQCTAGRVVF